MALKIPPPLWLTLFGALMWLIAKTLPGAPWHAPGLAITLFLIGSVLCLSGAYALHQARTTLNPHHPENSRTLVRHGIYRYSRNPIYLGMAFLLAAWAAHLGHALPWLGIAGFIYCLNRYQIRPEETILHNTFTTDYEHYSRHTRRWL